MGLTLEPGVEKTVDEPNVKIEQPDDGLHLKDEGPDERHLHHIASCHVLHHDLAFTIQIRIACPSS